MPKVAIIRCEKNSEKCPLTACFASVDAGKGAFEVHQDKCTLSGVFTCRCPGDNVVDLAKILKDKGAECIHFCTCTFATKADGGWTMDNGGFCKIIDDIIERTYKEVGIPCVKGTAHLPQDYTVQMWQQSVFLLFGKGLL